MEIGSIFLFLLLSCQIKHRLMLVFGICAHTISPQRYTLYIIQIEMGTAFIDVKFNNFDTQTNSARTYLLATISISKHARLVFW
jgi:hypothetical protein